MNPNAGITGKLETHCMFDIHCVCVFMCVLLTMVFSLAVVATHTGLRGDGHQGLANSLLPGVCHLQTNSRCCKHGAGVLHACVLPYVIHHVVRDDLEAVWISSLRKATEVLCQLHLQDL